LSDEERRIEIEGDDEDDILEDDSGQDSADYEKFEEEELIDEDSPDAMAAAMAKADEEATQGAPEWEISDEELEDLDAHHFVEPQEKGEDASQAKIQELNEKYVRLYAEFDNYKKRAAKDRVDLTKFVREELVYELLPSLDHLDIALKHAGEDESTAGLKQGVEMTLRELHRTLEKFGLKVIEAEGKPFDPEYHHAVSQVESDELEDKTVVEEMRRGYMFGDKVLRASMVSVSRKPGEGASEEGEAGENENENE
jgi:molecular chaperone GrpE